MYKIDGVRFIAGLEFLKGALALFLLFGVWEMRILGIHFNHGPAFLNLIIDKINHESPTLVVSFVLAYTLVRIVEGYGLWTRKNWGKWMAIVATSLYLPFEFYELFESFNLIKFGLIITNLLVLAFLLHKKRMSKV
jgi:hypothetical protein